MNIAMTLINLRHEPRELPVREEVSLKTEPVVKIAGSLVIVAVVVFFVIFW